MGTGFKTNNVEALKADIEAIFHDRSTMDGLTLTPRETAELAQKHGLTEAWVANSAKSIVMSFSKADVTAAKRLPTFVLEALVRERLTEEAERAMVADAHARNMLLSFEDGLPKDADEKSTKRQAERELHN